MELTKGDLKNAKARTPEEILGVLERIDKGNDNTQHTRVRARNGTTRLALMFGLGLYDVTYLPNGEAHFTPNDALEAIRTKQREG